MQAFPIWHFPVIPQVPVNLPQAGRAVLKDTPHSKLLRPGGQQIGPWPLNVGVEEVIKQCKVN